MKNVASRDNPTFRAIVRLATSAAERRKRGLTVLDGAHLVGAFLDAGHGVETLLVSHSALERPEVACVLVPPEQRELRDLDFRQLKYG